MGDIGGAAQAAASVGDTAMTDALNMYEQSQNREFNAEQANAQREWEAGQQTKTEDFNASQAALNRTFQADQQVQAENYNTQMSDTAMQRRVTDLKAANLNPLLAVGNLGGASTPTMSAPSGSTASVGTPQGASASSNTLPNIQPLLSGYAALRQSNAQATAAEAQAKKTTSETPTPRYVSVETNSDGTQSITVTNTAGHELGDQALENQKAVVSQINSSISLNASQISLNDALSAIKGLDRSVLADTMDGLIKAQNANNALSTTLAGSGQKVLATQVAGQNLGVWIEALRMAIGASKGN